MSVYDVVKRSLMRTISTIPASLSAMKAWTINTTVAMSLAISMARTTSHTRSQWPRPPPGRSAALHAAVGRYVSRVAPRMIAALRFTLGAALPRDTIQSFRHQVGPQRHRRSMSKRRRRRVARLFALSESSLT